jgi:hypothetical protein
VLARGWAGVAAPPFRKDLIYAATLLAALPTVGTLVLEWIAGWPVSNVARATAGVSLGFVLGFVVPTVDYGECTPRRPIGHGQPPSTLI